MPRRRLFDNLLNRHFAIPEKPPNPDLACATSAQPAYGNTPRAMLDKTVMQKVPGPVQTKIPKIGHITLYASGSPSWPFP